VVWFCARDATQDIVDLITGAAAAAAGDI